MARTRKVQEEQKNKGRHRKISGIVMVLAGLLVALSFIGVTGDFLSEMCAYLLGMGAFLAPLALIICGVYLFAFSGPFSISRRAFALVLLLLCLLGIAHHIFTPNGQELDPYSWPEGGGFIGGIILWTLHKIAGTAGALIILIVLSLTSVLLLSRLSLQLLLMKIKNSFSSMRKRDERKEAAASASTKATIAKPANSDRQFNPYRDGEFSEFTEGLEKQSTFKKLFGKNKKPVVNEHLVNYNEESFDDYQNDSLDEETIETKARQVFFAAPSEDDYSRIKPHVKPVVEKFTEPENIKPPSGSFLNPYKEKIIDFTDTEEKAVHYSEPEEKQEETVADRPLNIADSADLIKEQAEQPAQADEAEKPAADSGYKIPPLTLLNTPVVTKDQNLEEGIRHQCGILEQTLADFKVRANVVAVTRGPSVTRFELEPAPGVKVKSGGRHCFEAGSAGRAY